ncbi:thioesterase II family protein [Pseudonocardia sp. ICBG1142]|uniref:thioesterase II family protein n=1 Tax=Pseudonocardia sp. ICBG1142 TaxID=2846760 RepID=UPI001CF63C25|nr:thioesterase domain-containing protein [Pseudonocardia sp. ICBG1142]
MTRTTSWLQREPIGVAPRVFCLPHAGCGTSVFRNWPAARDGVEFLPVELPGRLARFGAPQPDTLQELAAAMADGLRPRLDVPFAFFGHCWSALLAYEVTAQLQELAGSHARHLFVSSQLAPQDGPSGRMLGMDEAGLETELAAMIRDQGGASPHPELLAIYVGVLRADVEASRRYVVQDPVRLSCPITAVGWDADTEVAPRQMHGWRRCGETGFTVLPGRHHRFVDAPAELLTLLAAAMTGPDFT